MTSEWRLYKSANLAVLAFLLRDLPVSCKDAVLPKRLLKKCTINCLTSEASTRQPHNENLCLLLPLLFISTEKTTGRRNLQNFQTIQKLIAWFQSNNVKRVHINSITVVEVLLTLNILLYHIVIVDRKVIVENTVQLLRFINYNYYVSTINVVFQCFCCPRFNISLNRTSNLEQHLTICSERAENVSPGRDIKFEKHSLTSWTLLD